MLFCQIIVEIKMKILNSPGILSTTRPIRRIDASKVYSFWFIIIQYPMIVSVRCILWVFGHYFSQLAPNCSKMIDLALFLLRVSHFMSFSAQQ